MRTVLSLMFIFATVAMSSSTMTLLIFGGNGFIGSHVSERLLDSGHRLTLASSRGSFSWDTVKTVRPRIVRHFRCDRYNPSHCDAGFWRQLDEAASDFDAVLDFSAYRLDAVQPFYKRLVKSNGDGKRPLYIYISTDSVYEVCERLDEERLLKETDSVRPIDEHERLHLAKRDSYGDRKLQIEEYLVDQRQSHSGLPYTILRLPDVLGERDSTQRWWKYQLWLRYGKSVNHPVQIPAFARSLSTSFVDVKDVAAIVELILNQRPKSHDQIYNVGFPTPIGLLDLLTEMKSHCGAPEGAIFSGTSSTSDQEGEEIVSFFPSVTRGGIDVSKAQTELGWRPSTDWRDAVKRISKFYLDAETGYENEMVDTARVLMRDLRLKQEERIQFLEALHGGDSTEPKSKKVKDEF